VRPSAGSASALDTTGPPLGIDSDSVFGPTERVQLEAGDLVVVLTDGFFEWASAQGEAFGVERATECLLRHAPCSAEEQVRELYRAVSRFAGDEPQADDLTAVIIKRL